MNSNRTKTTAKLDEELDGETELNGQLDELDGDSDDGETEC